MKRILLLIAVILATCKISFAQNRIGVIVGVNNSILNIENREHLTKYKPGFIIGVRDELDISKTFRNVFFSFEARLTSKGVKSDWYKVFNLNYLVESNPELDKIHRKALINLYYLNIPINVGYKIPLNKNLTTYIEGGVYLGYGLWGNAKEDSTDQDFDIKSEDPFQKKIYKRSDYGLDLGIGINIKKSLQFSIGYEYGLNNIIGERANPSKVNNESFRANLTYYF